MPRRPKKPCSYPGCPRLTNGRYCEEHQKQENKRYEKYQRNPATKKRYGEQWQRIHKSSTQSALNNFLEREDITMSQQALSKARSKFLSYAVS